MKSCQWLILVIIGCLIGCNNGSRDTEEPAEKVCPECPEKECPQKVCPECQQCPDHLSYEEQKKTFICPENTTKFTRVGLDFLLACVDSYDRVQGKSQFFVGSTLALDGVVGNDRACGTQYCYLNESRVPCEQFELVMNALFQLISSEKGGIGHMDMRTRFKLQEMDLFDTVMALFQGYGENKSLFRGVEFVESLLSEQGCKMTYYGADCGQCPSDSSYSVQRSRSPRSSSRTITRAQCKKVKTGMRQKKVLEMLGQPPEDGIHWSEGETMGVSQAMGMWEIDGGGTCMVMFQKGRVFTVRR